MLTPSAYSAECFRLAVDYIRDVYTGVADVGKYERLAVEYHERLAREMDVRRIYWDESSVDRVYRFFSLLKHTTGRWAGTQFMLAPWQAFIVLVVFGWKRRLNDFRLIRFLYIQVARKNGKTTFLGGIGLYLLAFDDEPSAQVVTAATKLAQARLMHAEAIKMVTVSPRLSSVLNIKRDNISRDDTFSNYYPLGADAKTQDGLNPHGALIDELHAHESKAMWDVLITALGARTQSLVAAITTAGYDENTICGEQRNYCMKVLDGILEDDEYFAFICEPDEEDLWDDERVWRKGNPSLGITVEVDELRRSCARAKASNDEHDWRQKRLDQWTQAAQTWFKTEHWKALPTTRVSFEKKRCFGGLDLATVYDIAAFVLVFPPQQGIPVTSLLPFFYVPQDSITDIVKEKRLPYDRWVRNGHLIATPGNVIDYEWIRQDILRIQQLYDLVEIGFDPYNATYLVTQLENNDGVRMVEMRQGWATMSPPSKHFEALVVSGQLNPSDNPVMHWMASNAVKRTDASGNIKPDKEKARQKIDGIVAAIMGVGRSIAYEGDQMQQAGFTAVRR